MKNKGITLVELIICVALLFLVIPLFWNYINSSVEDSGNVNNKVMVQSSVNVLMSRVQADVQEARLPINPTTNDEVEDDGFLVCKPNDDNVLYFFDKEKNAVTRKSGFNWEVNWDAVNGVTINKLGETVGVTEEFNYISEFTLETVSNNGIKVHIRGEIDKKSGYDLDGEYYTRNTMW